MLAGMLSTTLAACSVLFFSVVVAERGLEHLDYFHEFEDDPTVKAEKTAHRQSVSVRNRPLGLISVDGFAVLHADKKLRHNYTHQSATQPNPVSVASVIAADGDPTVKLDVLPKLLTMSTCATYAVCCFLGILMLVWSCLVLPMPHRHHLYNKETATEREGCNGIDEFEEWETKTHFLYISKREQFLWTSVATVLALLACCTARVGYMQHADHLGTYWSIVHQPCATMYRLEFLLLLVPSVPFSGILFGLAYYGEFCKRMALIGAGVSLFIYPMMLVGCGSMVGIILLSTSVFLLHILCELGIAFKDVRIANVRWARWWCLSLTPLWGSIGPLLLYKWLAVAHPCKAAMIYVTGIPALEGIVALALHNAYLHKVYNPRELAWKQAQNESVEGEELVNEEDIVVGDQKMLLSVTVHAFVVVFGTIRFLMLVEGVLADPSDADTWTAVKYSLGGQAIMGVIMRLRLIQWILAKATMNVDSFLVKLFHECMLPSPLVLYCNFLQYRVVYIHYAAVLVVLLSHWQATWLGGENAFAKGDTLELCILWVAVASLLEEVMESLLTWVAEWLLSDYIDWKTMPYFVQLKERTPDICPVCHIEQVDEENPCLQYEYMPIWMAGYMVMTASACGFGLMFLVLGQQWVLGFADYDLSLDTTSIWWPPEPQCSPLTLTEIVDSFKKAELPFCKRIP